MDIDDLVDKKKQVSVFVVRHNDGDRAIITADMEEYDITTYFTLRQVDAVHYMPMLLALLNERLSDKGLRPDDIELVFDVRPRG